MGANPCEPFFGTALLGQGGQLLFKVVPLGGNFGGDLGKCLRRLSRGQTRGCRHECATSLGDRKSSGYLRDGSLVHLLLGIADLIEREPAHQAGEHGEGHGRANAHVELHGEAVSGCEQAFE